MFLYLRLHHNDIFYSIIMQLTKKKKGKIIST